MEKPAWYRFRRWMIWVALVAYVLHPYYLPAPPRVCVPVYLAVMLGIYLLPGGPFRHLKK